MSRRRPAPCPVVDSCGGCALQTRAYAQQLALKRQQVRQLLGPLCPAQVSIVGLDPPFGFRTKLLMPAGGRAGAIDFGLYRQGSLELVAASFCCVQHPATLGLLAMIRAVLDAQGVGPSAAGASHRRTRTRHTPFELHALGIRIDPASEQSEVVLCCSHDVARPLVEQLAPLCSGLHACVAPRRSSFPLQGRFVHLAGRSRIAFTLRGQVFSLGPRTFFQTTARGAELLAHAVHDLLPSACGRFADLYGGAGIHALLLRARWDTALVVEENPHALADLEHQLARESLPRLIAAPAGRVENRLDVLGSFAPDVVLLDPPRQGCHPEVISALVALAPKTVLYIACGLDALARDVTLLVQGGYRLSAVRGVDLFAHTPHLEVVARLDR